MAGSRSNLLNCLPACLVRENEGWEEVEGVRRDRDKEGRGREKERGEENGGGDKR